MELLEIVNKLVGPITPTAESNKDQERLKNMETMCGLVEQLIVQIDDVAYQNQDRHEYSVKKIVERADKFLEKNIGE